MKRNDKVLKAFSVLLAILLWQLAAMLLDSPLLLASPLDVVLRMLRLWKEPGFFSALWFTFSRILGGFFLGLAVGALLAFFAARWRVAELLLMPYMLTVKSVPVASFVVIALIWLTSRSLSVFISFLIVLPIVYSNLLAGLKNEDKNLTEMADVFSVPYRRRLLYIRLPQLRPFVTSACSVSCGLAWKSGVAAEIIGIPDGSVGEMLYYSRVYLDTEGLFAWTVIIVLMSVGFEKLFLKILNTLLDRTERL